MSKSAKAQEPSMEEILASIRRIIADEGTPPGEGAKQSGPQSPLPASATGGTTSAASPPAAPAGQANPGLAAADSPPDDESGVLELDQPVDPAPAGFTAIRGPDVVFSGDEPQEEPAPPDPHYSAAPPPPSPDESSAYALAPRREPAMRDEDLLSPDASAAASAAFGALAHTILQENSRTLEDIVREMMRPMLKEWLDQNLPGLVERMVRAEIERVARGGR